MYVNLSVNPDSKAGMLVNKIIQKGGQQFNTL